MITPEEALALLKEKEAGKAERLAKLKAEGYPAYTTSVGWCVLISACLKLNKIR